MHVSFSLSIVVKILRSHEIQTYLCWLAMVSGLAGVVGFCCKATELPETKYRENPEQALGKPSPNPSVCGLSGFSLTPFGASVPF